LPGLWRGASECQFGPQDTSSLLGLSVAKDGITVNLTKGQEAALEAIAEIQSAFPAGGGIVRIAGYAGTGKTTLLKVLAEDDHLCVLAPTGKAALRVREATGIDASTVHRWLYIPIEDPQTGTLRFELRDSLAVPPNRLVFVDEASMVSFQMFKDLYWAAQTFEFNLVFLGDGFQLPPVSTDGPNFNIMGPEAPVHIKVQMTEVVRQALDSPIIRASMRCRNLRDNLDFLGTDIPVIGSSELALKGAEMWERGGATICHRNATRHSLNFDIRKQLNRPENYVVANEPLMVLFNDYEIEAYNGEILTTEMAPRMLGNRPYPVRDRFSNETMNMNFYLTSVSTITGTHRVVFADKEVFGQNNNVSMKAIRTAGRELTRNLLIKEREEISGGWVSPDERKNIVGHPVLNVNLGYTLTAHKAQGSEFPEVLVVVEPSIRPHTEEGRRWLYTALTRAKKKAMVCWM